MVEEILKLWKKLEEKKCPYYDDGWRGYNFYDESNPDVNYLVGELNQFLIDNGGVNYKNKELLEKNGFAVRCVESDGFGWLIGAVIKLDAKSGVYFG